MTAKIFYRLLSWFLVFGFLTLLGIFYLTGFSAPVGREMKQTASRSGVVCATKMERFEVRGDSLAPLIKPGQTIELVSGYYNCQPVQREDIVAYKYAGNQAPIIKIVKAVPGDKWRLEADKPGQAYQILVNDGPLKNSLGQLYQISAANSKMLKLYAQSYSTIPENTYLILGNQIAGSLDATRFGLISQSDILGKVEAEN